MCTSIPRSHGPDIELKWHSLRRRPTEPAMLRENLEAGLAAGAVMEADIRLTRDGRWVCLHDEILDHETSGSGAVRDHTAAQLRALTMRNAVGGITTAPLLFIDDLAASVARRSNASAELQLDVKAGADELTDAILERFASLVGPVADRFSLSGTDPRALARLREAVPSLAVTFSCSSRLGGARDAAQLESRAVSAFNEPGDISMLWVNHRVLQAAYRTRFDLVGFARRNGVGIDTGTIDVGRGDWRAALVLALQARVTRITTNSPCAVAEQVERWARETRPTVAAS